MAANFQELQKDLLNLSLQERLRLAYWLIETVLPQSSAFQEVEIPNVKATAQVEDSENPLLRLADRFSGGPGAMTENAGKILKSQVNAISGLSG